jgi:general secretion pathway protein L
MKEYFTPPGKNARQQVLIRQCEGACRYQWVAVKDGTCGIVQGGSLEQLALDCQVLGLCELNMLLSADAVNLKTVALSEEELRHYRKLLPYAIEDDLAEVTDDLHFAYTAPVEGLVGVAVVRASVLTDYLDRFAEHDLVLAAVLPEILLLPWQQEEQTWMLQDGYVVAHQGRFDGFKVHPSLLPALAESLLSDQEGEAPMRVSMACEQQSMDTRPELASLQSGFDIDWQLVDSLLAWQASRLSEASMNLLQGAFNTSLQWRQYRREWMPVVAVCIAALLLNFGALVYHYQTQKQLSVDLQAQKYALAREVLPSGRIQSPERQVRAMLNQLQTGGPTRFTALLALVGPHLQGEAGYSVRNITFDGRTSILRLEVRAKNFQQIEQFRAAMKKNAVRAKLLNSSARGEGILARLELSEDR